MRSIALLPAYSTRGTDVILRSFIWRASHSSAPTQPNVVAAGRYQSQRRSSIAIYRPDRRRRPGGQHTQRSVLQPDAFLSDFQQSRLMRIGTARCLPTTCNKHLRVVRGLHPKTCEGLALTARRMLAWQRQHLRDMPLPTLGAKHVLVMTRDLVSGGRTDSTRSSTTSQMRSFLRYMCWTGLNNAEDLAHFVPTTPCWRHAHLPSRLPWG